MYEYKATVTKVNNNNLVVDIDLGFNIIHVNQTIKLARIDIPKASSAKEFNLHNRLIGLLLNKQVIINITKEDEAEVYLNDLNISDYLLTHNYATSTLN